MARSIPYSATVGPESAEWDEFGRVRADVGHIPEETSAQTKPTCDPRAWRQRQCRFQGSSSRVLCAAMACGRKLRADALQYDSQITSSDDAEGNSTWVNRWSLPSYYLHMLALPNPYIVVGGMPHLVPLHNSGGAAPGVVMEHRAVDYMDVSFDEVTCSCRKCHCFTSAQVAAFGPRRKARPCCRCCHVLSYRVPQARAKSPISLAKCAPFFFYAALGVCKTGRQRRARLLHHASRSQMCAR